MGPRPSDTPSPSRADRAVGPVPSAGGGGRAHRSRSRSARLARVLPLAIALLGATCSPETEPPLPPPNLLVWLVDTLRADHLGCYGYDRPTSPHIDRVAREGARFEAFHATSNWTQPSVASFLTGTYPPVFKADFGSRLPSSLPTAAWALRRAGYATTGITVSVATSRHFGFDRDFENYLELFRAEPPSEWKRRTTSTFEAGRVVDAALAWLDGEARPVREGDPAIRPRGDRPFFLFLHTLDPHLPYHRHEGVPSFADPEYDGPQDGSLKPMRRPNEEGWKHPGAARDLRHLRDLYDHEIAYNDAQFGRLLAGLEERGLLDDTVVVVLADHGEELGERGFYGHGHHNLHAELSHVPWIVRWPARIPAGTVVHDLASGIDVLPTLLDLLGVEPLRSAEGRSFAAALTGGEGGGDGGQRVVFVDRARSKRDSDAIRTPAFLLTRTFEEETERPHRRLFDLAADPKETEDVAASRPEVLRTLFRRLLDWKKRLNQRRELWGAAVTGDLDEETRRRLEELGYLQR